MQPWGMVQYPSVTQPVFTEPEKLGMGGSDAVVVFRPRTVAQTFFFVGEPADTPPESDTDLLTKWFQPPSEPYPAPEYPVAEGFFHIDPARLLDHETTFLPAWSSIYPDLHLLPQYPVYEGGINAGFELAESTDRPPVFHGDQTTLIFDFVVITQSFFTDPNPEPEPPEPLPEVTMDSWYQPWSEPLREPPNTYFFMPVITDIILGLPEEERHGWVDMPRVDRASPPTVTRADVPRITRRI
jgi:hypothetical protein